MKPYLIYFWHGRPSDKDYPFFMGKIRQMCREQPLDGVLVFDGNLEEFAKKWKDRFIYLPPDEENDYINGTICITQWGSFGQR